MNIVIVEDEEAHGRLLKQYIEEWAKKQNKTVHTFIYECGTPLFLLSSCRFCDRIAVFDKGRLVQTGSHEELLQDKEGTYAALWNAQAKYYEADLPAM